MTSLADQGKALIDSLVDAEIGHSWEADQGWDVKTIQKAEQEVKAARKLVKAWLRKLKKMKAV